MLFVFNNSGRIALALVLAHCQSGVTITPAQSHAALLETIVLQGELGLAGATGDTGATGPANTDAPVYGMRLSCTDNAVTFTNGVMGCDTANNAQDLVVQGKGGVADPTPGDAATLVVTADATADALRAEASAGGVALDVRGGSDFSDVTSMHLPLRWVVTSGTLSVLALCNAKEIVVGGGCQLVANNSAYMKMSCPGATTSACVANGGSAVGWLCQANTSGAVTASVHCLQVAP